VPWIGKIAADKRKFTFGQLGAMERRGRSKGVGGPVKGTTYNLKTPAAVGRRELSRQGKGKKSIFPQCLRI